jgi:hypothetical protein
MFPPLCTLENGTEVQITCQGCGGDVEGLRAERGPAWPIAARDSRSAVPADWHKFAAAETSALSGDQCHTPLIASPM